MKNLIGNLLLLSISLTFVFLVGEVASRYVTPISPGPSILDMDGNKQNISYIEPGKQFRIMTPDFDAVTTITEDGYRAPKAKGNPDVLFIGDSFTYAQGVRDNEAFPAIYCKERNLECANLSVPGSSTIYELDRLEHFIKTKNWSPKMVNLFFFTGNDFSDNIYAAENRKQGLPYEPVELNTNAEQNEEKNPIKKLIGAGLKHSNLLRVAYFKVLPMIRETPEDKENTLNKALQITKSEFMRLEKLSKVYSFDYNIYILHPEVSIRQNTYQELDKKLQTLTKHPLITLGSLFKKDTKRFYFPTDGHFTVAGNNTIADYLINN